MADSTSLSVTLKDFQPYNSWKVEGNGKKYEGGKPANLIDETTGRKYGNESKGCVRFKCALLTLGTPLVHAIAAPLNVAYRILKLISFFHFWKPQEGNYSFKARALDAAADLLRVVGTPIALLGLELSAVFGIFTPYDGRKLYASFERAFYNHFILAPCFQPDPKTHLLGGDPNKPDQF
ncbi:MAG: hypothetical protein K940chlam7_00579 [Chlamydiae bacterium]|nr:hypothetical protein [Chlamydiota bacterium]